MDIFFNVHLLQWFYKEYIYIYLCRIAHEHVLQKSCINSLYLLHKFIWNFMNITVRHDYHDYVGKIWNELGNVYP